MNTEEHKPVKENDKERYAQCITEIFKYTPFSTIKVTVIRTINPINHKGWNHQNQKRNEKQVSISLLHAIVSRGPHQGHDHKHQKMIKERSLDDKTKEGMVTDMVIEDQTHNAAIVNDGRQTGYARPVQVRFLLGKRDHREQHPKQRANVEGQRRLIAKGPKLPILPNPIQRVQRQCDDRTNFEHLLKVNPFLLNQNMKSNRYDEHKHHICNMLKS